MLFTFPVCMHFAGGLCGELGVKGCGWVMFVLIIGNLLADIMIGGLKGNG